MELFIYFVVGAMLLIVIGMLASIVRFSQNIKSLEKASGKKVTQNSRAIPPGKSILQQPA